MALPLITAAYVYTLPESPRWLLLKARQGKTEYYEKAFRSLCKLRRTRLQAARDLFLIHHLLDGEEEIKQRRNRFIELWSVARNRLCHWMVHDLLVSISLLLLRNLAKTLSSLVYETKDLSLEQLDARFEIPTKTHARWAIKEAVFVFKYYILRRKETQRPILSVSTQGLEDVDMVSMPPRKLSIDIEERSSTASMA